MMRVKFKTSILNLKHNLSLEKLAVCSRAMSKVSRTRNLLLEWAVSKIFSTQLPSLQKIPTTPIRKSFHRCVAALKRRSWTWMCCNTKLAWIPSLTWSNWKRRALDERTLNRLAKFWRVTSEPSISKSAKCLSSTWTRQLSHKWERALQIFVSQMAIDLCDSSLTTKYTSSQTKIKR